MFSFPFLQNPCKKKRYKWKEMTWFIYLASDFLQRKQKRQKFQDEKHSYMNNNKYEYQIDIKYFWVVTKISSSISNIWYDKFIYLFILDYLYYINFTTVTSKLFWLKVAHSYVLSFFESRLIYVCPSMNYMLPICIINIMGLATWRKNR